MTTETTTLLLDIQNANIVRALYISNIGRDKTMMADINLHNKNMGKDIESRGEISEFYMNTIIGAFRRLSLIGCYSMNNNCDFGIYYQ